MALKTDFKDDIFEGNRKYKLSQDSEGNTEIQDVTAYTQEGDLFAAEHINATNREVNRLSNEVEITLLVSGWSGSAPYTQTVEVPGLKETDKVQLMSAAKKDTPAETVKVWDKMAGMIKAGEALDGQVAFYCPIKKPTEDFNVKLVGVSVNE